jgi:hypothetical protein
MLRSHNPPDVAKFAEDLQAGVNVFNIGVNPAFETSPPLCNGRQKF